MPHLFALCCAAIALTTPTWAQEPVLTADVGPQLEAAFARVAPTFVLKDAQIQPHGVAARVCRPDGSCLDMQLTPAKAACAGEIAGTWCVQFPAGRPTDAPTLLQVLDVSRSWWRALVPRLPTAQSSRLDVLLLLLRLLSPALVLWLIWQRRVPWRRARLLLPILVLEYLLWGATPAFLDSNPQLQTATWLLVWWLWPLSVGATFGLIFRWGGLPRPQTGTTAALAVLLVPAIFAAQALAWHRIGAMDGGAMGLVAALCGLALGHARFSRPHAWGLSLASLAVALALLELAARLVLPPPPVLEHEAITLLNPDSPRPDRLPVAAGHALVHCALHASVGEETSRCLRLGPLPHDAPWLLHLGDSMLFGSGVTVADALPAQLAQQLPQLYHLNAGVPGTSIDVELALLLRIMPLARPSGVVLYVMPGNDVDEVDTPVESCTNAPPLEWTTSVPRLRCPVAQWPPRPWYALLLQSRLPLPIAALTDLSFTARHLVWLQRLAIEPPRAHDPRPSGDAEAYRRTLAGLVAVLKNAHVPLQIVVMPLRRSAYGAHTDARRAQLLGILQSLQLPFLDAQNAVDGWVQAQGESAIFLTDPPGDIHLNARGLAQLARFLAPQLVLPQGHTPTE